MLKISEVSNSTKRDVEFGDSDFFVSLVYDWSRADDSGKFEQVKIISVILFHCRSHQKWTQHNSEENFIYSSCKCCSSTRTRKTIDEIIEALVKDPLNKVLKDKLGWDV